MGARSSTSTAAGRDSGAATPPTSGGRSWPAFTTRPSAIATRDASEEAARLTDELVRRMPGDETVAFLAIESRIKDRKDPQGALADLAAISFPADQPRLAIRHALLTAEAWKAAGMPDSAQAILASLKQKFPDNAGVQRAIDALK